MTAIKLPPDPISKKEARALGRTRFYTGVPCRRGHVAERLVRSGNCLECHRIARKEYYKRYPEKKAEGLAKLRKLQGTEEWRATQREYYRNWEMKARAALRALKELGIEI